MTDRARWLLSDGTLAVWPFDSRAQAEVWRDERDLDGFTARPMIEHDEHIQVCARCREPWPCAHQRAVRSAEHVLLQAANECARCGRNTMHRMRIQVGERFYCGRQGACRNQALRELAAAGEHAEVAHFERLVEGERRFRERCRQQRDNEARRWLGLA